MQTIVARFTTLGEAEIARSALDAAEIDCRIDDENMIAIDWLVSNAVGGVKLLVDEEDREAAEEVLANRAAPDADGDAFEAPVPADSPPPLASDMIEPRCPRCGSAELYRIPYRRLKAIPLFAVPVVLVVLPIYFLLPKWKCDSCGLRKWF